MDAREVAQRAARRYRGCVPERWYKIKELGEREWRTLVTARDHQLQPGDTLPLGDGDESAWVVLESELDEERPYTARLIVERRTLR